MNSRLAAWRRFVSGAALGAIAGFGQAPYDQPIVLALAFGIAVWLFQHQRTAGQAAQFGWALGVGYFAHSLQWIVSPFLVDVARHGWMAPFALVFLASGLALFWGLAFWAARRLSPDLLWPLAFCWTGVEVLRAYVFTGFPWAMPAQAFVDTLAGQALSLFGPHGLNLILFAGLVIGVAGGQSGARRIWQGVLFLGAGTLIILGPQAPDAPLKTEVIRLVQPNAAQRDKWDPEQIPIFFSRQLKFTTAPPKEGQNPPDLVIWPETAIPWLLDLAPPVLMQISQAAGGTPVALGVQRRDDRNYYNSMVALGPEGQVTQLYDKHHLVPFGEYLPFGSVLARIGLRGLAEQMGGYGAGPGPALMDFGPLGQALPLICYEAVFAHDVNGAPSRPAFLVQITNDAWFGKGAGPKQHLAQARMRAIEQGLPLARAANTGISAMIDPWGRVLAFLPLNEAGFVDAALPMPRAQTVYSRTGDLPLVVLLAALLAALAYRARRV